MTWGMVGAAGVSAVGSYIGGSKQAKSSKKAMKAIAEQMRLNREEEKRRLGVMREDLSPYTGAGATALDQTLSQLGLSSAPAYDITQMPGYQGLVDERLRAVNEGAAGSGMLFSGARGKALADVGAQTYQDFYQNYLNRLQGLSSAGQQGVTTLGTAGLSSGAQQASLGMQGAMGISNIGVNQGANEQAMWQDIAGGIGAGIGAFQ